MRCILKCSIAALVVLLTLSTPLWAQVLVHSGEVAGTYSYVNSTGFSGHQGYGGSGGINLAKRVTLVGEYSYLSLSYLTPNVGVTNSTTNELGGVAVRINFLSDQRIVPYVVIGAGIEHVNFTIGSASAATDNGYYDAYGGGASIYLTKNIGVRPEFRYDYELGITDVFGQPVYSYQNVYQFSGSLFFQFGGRK